MSPASKLKSKDKLAAKAVKEQANTSVKSTPIPANNGNGIPGSAYNPHLGTFHALETAPSALLPSQHGNGRFRTIDEGDNHSGSSLGTSAEFDSLSNNDSCSGESEDLKEKTIVANSRTESIPGCDNDKRDKIRQKNERKHQRQKEKRAQELHEKCNGYLMSRKLEVLAQQFVAMGFSSERATMALILNEGRVEESVAWLLEGDENGEPQAATNLDGANLKIDITDEVGQIAVLERKYKCTKQEVERAVVACEGDVAKAEDALKAQKQETNAVPPSLKQSGEHIIPANDISNRLPPAVQNPAGRTPMKGVAPTSVLQQGKDDRGFSYAKPEPTAPQIEFTNRNMQPPRKITVKQERSRVQVTAPLDKRRMTTSSSTPASHSLVPPLPVTIPHVNSEVRLGVSGGNEGKIGMQAAATLKEPITMMQRPQSSLPKQNIPSSSIKFSVSPPSSTGRHPNSIPSIESMTMAAANGGVGRHLRNSSLNGSTSQQFYPQNHYQPFASGPMEPGVGSTSQQFYPQNHYQPFPSSTMETGLPGWSTSTTLTPSLTRRSSSIALPSSLGLFSARGSSTSSTAVDWSTGGLMPKFDYTNIDWSLDSTPLPSSAPQNNHLYNTQLMPFTSQRVSRPDINNGMYIGGLQDGNRVSDPSNSVGPYEWTSPFAGRDLFRAPRQSVTSPSP